MDGGDLPGLEAAWRKLEQDWDSDEAHRRFVAYCAQHGALDQAGRRYRQVRDANPARRDAATRRLSAVMVAALEQLSLARTPPRAARRRLVWLMVGACGFLLLQAVLALLHRRSQ
jgi:hypothetical protein